MIIAAWQRWTRDHHFRWLALCLAVLVVDLLIGSWLIAWEIALFREAIGR